jgi:uncharacterized alpha-E superfamily protein
MWENINATWLEIRGIAEQGLSRYGMSRFCEWIKERSHLFRGASYGTIMRNDAFRFIRLGPSSSAPTTRCACSMRYEMAGDQAEAVSDGTAHAYYQWSALLRALSSFEAYTEIYRDAPGARHVAELLLLRADVPRSLRACTEEIDQILAQLPGANGRPAQRLAAEMDARLRYTGINEILDEGLHAWLTEFIPLVRQLGNAIHSSYLEAA